MFLLGWHVLLKKLDFQGFTTELQLQRYFVHIMKGFSDRKNSSIPICRQWQWSESMLPTYFSLFWHHSWGGQRNFLGLNEKRQELLMMIGVLGKKTKRAKASLDLKHNFVCNTGMAVLYWEEVGICWNSQCVNRGK